VKAPATRSDARVPFEHGTRAVAFYAQGYKPHKRQSEREECAGDEDLGDTSHRILG
jgi:hypothetical protein